MNRLIATGAMLLALCSAPSIALAANSGEPAAARAAVAGAAGAPSAGPRPVGHARGDVGDYAAREAAAPSLGKFAGGDGVGIYVGGGALTAVLVVVLIVVLI